VIIRFKEGGVLMRLTSAQKQLYNLEMFAGESIGIICGTVLFDKIYDVDEMKHAINEVFRINESLRTRIKLENGKPVQYVTEYIEQDIKVFNFKTKDEVHEFADKMAHTPFDFAGNLCELGILTSENFCGVIYRLHHIISDGWTLALIASQFYKILHKETVEAFPYSTYLDEEEKYLQSKRITKDKEYFIEQYHKIDEPVYLFDTAPKIGKSIRKSYIIDKSKASQIMQYVEKENTSAYIFFLTLINTYFSKIKNNAEKFFIGTTVLNRTTHTHRNTAGTFVNTVPFLAEMDNECDFATNMKKTEENIFSLFRHQRYNYVDMLSDIGEDRLFDIIFSYQNNTIYGDHVLSTWYHNGMQNESLQIHIDDRDCDGVFRIHYDYQTEKFSESDVDVMHKRLLTIIQNILESNNKPICKLEYLTKKEKETILKEFNSTEHTYDIPKKSTLYSLFESVAKANADKVCLKIDGKEISFGNFKKNVEALDCRIREITENKKSIVAVICERSQEMYSAVYGIIRGGNAYLPIDPDYPQERINYILENSNAVLVVAQNKFMHLAENVPCINMTEIISNDVEAPDIPPCVANEDDTAYVIYTSGSTGKPKGAKVSHKSAVNRILWMHDKYPLSENDVILQKTPYTFDVSVWELFWWGILGGCLAPSKPGEHFLPAKILEEVFRNKVTHLHFVPSVFELFLNYVESHKDECFKFNTVKYVFLSGEVLSANLITRFYTLFDYNKITLHNLYGPTECAVDVTYYDCSPSDIDPVPIGKPIYNTQMYVVDKYMNPVPCGVTGELCICGVNVGQGYLNNPELSAEKFIDNPFGEGKLYKTGDLAYWREDGNIGFVGRIDSQIKLNGQRIEIGEIESVINAIEFVETVAVIVRKVNENDTLVAFYTGADNNETVIRDICSDKLPKYMVPSAIVHLDKLPLNQSGKLDRKELVQMQVTVTNTTESDEPINKSEKFICEAFEKILGLDKAGRNTDFFDNGGTSLSMIALLSENGFEEVTASEFMRNSTPAKLAKILKDKKVSDLEYLEPLYLPDKAQKAIILLPFAGGGSEAFSNLVTALKQKDNETAIYFIRYLHSFGECEEAAKEIATYLDDKEISLYSHCVGSALAIQILQSLEKNGIYVKKFFAGASIPLAKPTEKNIWNITPDILLKHILSKAGSQLKTLSDEKQSELLKRFREDTDFANISYCHAEIKISAPLTLIISKEDIFTKNYKNAEKNWSHYFSTINNVHFIDTKNHYFQAEKPAEVAIIIFSD